MSVEARGGCGILRTGGCEISSVGLGGCIRVLKEQQEPSPPVWVLSSPLSSPFQCVNYSSICGPSLCIFTKVQLTYHKLHIYIYLYLYIFSVYSLTYFGICISVQLFLQP